MKFTTKLTVFIIFLISITMVLVLVSAILSIYYTNNTISNQMWQILSLSFDQALSNYKLNEVQQWLPEIMKKNNISTISLISTNKDAIQYHYENSVNANFWDVLVATQWIDIDLPLHTDYKMIVNYVDPGISAIFSLQTLITISLVLAIIIIILTISFNWLSPRFKGIKLLETRAHLILTGNRLPSGNEVNEWPKDASKALDLLLYERKKYNRERIHVDTLIRKFFAQDSKTGLRSRLSFEYQLMTQLEGINAHGVVMMIRLADRVLPANLLTETRDLDLQDSIISMLSTFIKRYPSALFARYFDNDFAILLPHTSTKEADVIAVQLIQSLNTLTFSHDIDKQALMFIGISAYESGQTLENIIDYVIEATRNAELQGSNGWCVYQNKVAKVALGSVRKRSLIEQSIEKGDNLRFYEKPVMSKEGVLHHRVLNIRLFDGQQELQAAEYLLWAQQFNLICQFEQKVILQVIKLLDQLPNEKFALTISVEVLLNSSFKQWFVMTLRQKNRSLSKRLLLQFNEADVALHSERLISIFNLLKKLGCQIGVVETGLTVVNTAYIHRLTFDFIKLYAGLVRHLKQRQENQLMIESLCGAYVYTDVLVFATGIRSHNEWKVLCEKGIFGGQGILFAPFERLPI